MSVIQTAPQAIEVEQAILGAILINPKSIDRVLNLKPEMFYNIHNAVIFKAMISMSMRGDPIDIISLGEELKVQGSYDEIGPLYTTKLTTEVATSANIAYHATMLLDRHIRRAAISIFREYQEKAKDVGTPIENVISDLYNKIEALCEHVIPGPIHINKLLDGVISQIGKGVVGIETGFTAVDAILGGIKKKDHVLIAARTSQGKTTYALQCALHMAITLKLKVAIFSLEMTAEENLQRLLAYYLGMNERELMSEGLSIDKHAYAIEKAEGLRSIGIYIDEDAELTPNSLNLRLRKMIREHGVDIVIVDYLQLMNTPPEMRFPSREQQVAWVSRSMKRIAKKLCPVISIAQLGRGAEQREDKRPELQDLRESGSLEMDADTVILLYQPEEMAGAGDEDAPIDEYGRRAEAIVAKQRKGPTGSAAMMWNKELSRFQEVGAFHRYASKKEASRASSKKR